MYTHESIQAVKDLSILDVVGVFTQLDKKGKACCPLHGEKSPSFSVNAAKGIFKCFGCGAGGDGLRFVMLHEKKNFVEAVELLADKFGITLEEDSRTNSAQYKADQAKLKEVRKSLNEVLEHAYGQYTSSLYKPEHTAVMNYLKEERGLDDDDLAKWGLGYAPDINRFLCDVYSREGLLPKAIELGIVRELDDKRGYDLMRKRIIIPIHNEYGEIVSLAGRAFEDAQSEIEKAAGKKYPKYMNGPESPLYSKSKVLYGLYYALPTIKQTGTAILTEGYLDVISMHKYGATNTVATCGTALTAEMITLLIRYGVEEVILMRDSDAAGIKATQHDIPLLIEKGLRVDVFELQELEGKKIDPDVWAREFGKEESNTTVDISQEEILEEA